MALTNPPISLCLETRPLSHHVLLFDFEWLDVPDALGVFVDASVRGEETHAGHARDALGDPLVLVAVGGVDEILGLQVRVEIVRDQIVITVIDDAVDEGREGILVAKHAGLDGVKHFQELLVDDLGEIC